MSKKIEENKDKTKKKKKFKINYRKIFVWLALIAMIGTALLAIISPMMYGRY